MAYFDNAATTFPKPDCVYDYMYQFYHNCGGSYGRGNNTFSESAQSIVDKTRQAIRELLHCTAKQVVFQPSATVALNVIIQGVIANGARNIYISPFEHNAVTRVLHQYEKDGKIKVTILSVDNDLVFDIERISLQFDNIKPDLVILSHASNVIGLIAPVEEVFALSKRHGAITLVDMAQTAGLVDLNVGKDCIDFAVFAGHKTMYGPTGASGFVMTPSYKLPPILFGGTGFESANQNMPESLPERFEIGTLNTQAVAGLYQAISWINEQGIERLFKHELKCRERLIKIIESYDFMKIIGDSKKANYVGIVSCIMDGVSSDTAGQIFSERNIAVRTGLQCAPSAHRFLGTFPAGTVRFSSSFFTSEEDFEELQKALQDVEENLL